MQHGERFITSDAMSQVTSTATLHSFTDNSKAMCDALYLDGVTQSLVIVRGEDSDVK